ncbi:hypothetical protein NQ176_g2014 [Zarea fungicola]|uniref:Uncharacterized protein n=1 Tax=Zarea fungicola TaxID=93591 RepID=A0ACC1NQU8_9HYPO|nr:hypothetical protein NQ176_g2014 [Lecanicillium fungicola]
MNPLQTTAIIAFLAVKASALGINCQGSSQCGPTFGGPSDILASVQNIDPNHTYQNGEYIACAQNDLGTGKCAFLQGTGGITGDLIKTLVQDIVNHGCDKCGSVPVFFNAGDNDPNTHGILTINFVNSPGCNGLCPVAA